MLMVINAVMIVAAAAVTIPTLIDVVVPVRLLVPGRALSL